jgi:uncharacterized protein YbcI
VVLEDTLTKAERSLIDGGQAEVVLEMRRALQGAMRDALVEAVESLSGRRVIAFLSDHQAEPDFAVESFVLEPFPHDQDRDGHYSDRASSDGTRDGAILLMSERDGVS